MKNMKFLLMVLCSLLFTMCHAQQNGNDLEMLKHKFPKAYGMVNMKLENNVYPGIELTKEQAIDVLHIPEKQLKYIDVAYNYDTDEETYFDMETLPKVKFYLTKDTITILVYNIEYSYNYSNDWESNCYIVTINNHEEIIEKKLISREREQENQLQHFNAVILNDSTYRVFKYGINEKSAVLKSGSYEIIDKNEPQTKVTIVEYRIENDGHIVESGYKDIRYVKEPVLYYNHYRDNSDDPMNEYK